MNRFGIGFHECEELIMIGTKIIRSPLGTLWTDYLSTDFTVDRNQENEHPLIRCVRDSVSVDQTANKKLDVVMESFRRKMVAMTDAILSFDQSGYSGTEMLSRYCQTNRETAMYYASLPERITVGFWGVKGDEPVAWGCGEFSESVIFYEAESLQVVLLAELAEMAKKNVFLRKCSYCSSYFQPYSRRALYCDRKKIINDKSCKEVAARIKYEEKFLFDEVLQIYQRRCKTFSMRISRSKDPAEQKAHYQAWKEQAETAMQKYHNGEITKADCEKALTLPSTK